MASRKHYLELILGQLSGLEEITYRAMMGEFLTYYRGKLAGGIYNDRLLVKPKKAYVQKEGRGTSAGHSRDEALCDL